MKQFVSIAVLLMVTIGASGQTVKGTKAIGGGISYSKESSTDPDFGDEESTEFSIAPSFGYFVADRILVGVNVAFSKSETDTYPTPEETTNAFGPFARYYIHTSNEQFAFFGQASVMFASVKRSNEFLTEDVKGKELDINIAPGFAYFFNEHWALELGFRGIAFTNSDPNTDVDDDEVKSMQIGLNSLSPSTLGIRYHF